MSANIDTSTALSFFAGAGLTFLICKYLHEPPELDQPDDTDENDFLQIIRALRGPYTLADCVLLREKLGKVPQLKNQADEKRLKVLRRYHSSDQLYVKYYHEFKRSKHRIEEELAVNTRKIAFFLKKNT